MTGLQQIYEEPIGGPYKQFWAGARVGELAETGPRVVYLTSEGKRADFHAILVQNCASRDNQIGMIANDFRQRFATPSEVFDAAYALACTDGPQAELDTAPAPTGLKVVRSEGDVETGDLQLWYAGLIDVLPDGRRLIYFGSFGQRGIYQTVLRYDCAAPDRSERLLEGALKEITFEGEGIGWVAEQDYVGAGGLPIEIVLWPAQFCD